MATRHLLSSLFLGLTLTASTAAQARWPSSHTALEYYRGTWVCTDDTAAAGPAAGKPDQPMDEPEHGRQQGTATQSYLKVTKLTDYWYEFDWANSNVPGQATAQSTTYASYQHLLGAYTRDGLNSDGSSIHWRTPGWVNGTLVWSGTVNSNIGNVDTRVTDTFIDDNNFHTLYEVSPDSGNTWQRQAGANCARSLPSGLAQATP